MADALKLAFVLSATDKMSRVINDAVSKSTNKLNAFERNAAKVGRTMSTAGGLMTGAGLAVGAAALGIAKSASQYGDQVWKASQSTGMAVGEYQKLAYAARYSNVEQTELNAAMVRFNKRLSDAAAGSKSAGQIFTDLGVEIKDSAGNLRAPNEVFKDLAGKFASVKDGAGKTAAAYEIFGRSGANLIPLLNSGAKGLEDMGAEAERMGFVLSEQTAKASEQFNDNLSRTTDSVKGMMFQLGAALIPTLDKLAQKFTAAVQKVTDWVRANPGLTKTISAVLVVLTGLLTGLGALSVGIGGVMFVAAKFAAVWRGLMATVRAGKALFALASKSMLLFRIQYAALVVWQKIAAAAQWLFNSALMACPVVWIVAAVAAIGAAVYLLIKHWDKVSAFFRKLWDGVKKVFAVAWEWIKQMFLNYTPQGLIIKHWDTISAWFVRLWEGVKRVFSAAWNWVKQMFLNYTPQGLIIKHWDTISAWFVRLWEGVKNTFSAAWDWIRNLFSSLNPIEWISGVWDNVSAYFSELPGRFFQFGSDIITGLIDGVKSLAASAWESITGIGEGIKNRFKSFFGINSPSTLFMEYGVNITQGLTGGLEKGAPAVADITEGLAVRATRNIGSEIIAAGGSSDTVNNTGGVSLNYAPVINIQGNATPEAKAEFLQLLRTHRDEIIKIIRQYTENKERLAFS